ncbi:bifunctional histidinol-phosphatase/imidazoleglycerol-phosphate dehydratase HisB [Francisellaceae bacterium]|nr:bifunctional histidinol-phosphatase/imidazoleglycerol-phosphate dehydratase HisB [Francisellaceae bacterium]
MEQYKYLFIDRDGTLIYEPEDQQIDSIDKLDCLPGVFEGLLKLQRAGFKLIMVSNQDGLGTASFPQSDFDAPHDLMMKLFESQGISFEEILICHHLSEDSCDCRKPKVGLLMAYLRRQCIDLQHSYVIGDRETDVALAENLGIKSIRCGIKPFDDWSAIASFILDEPRIAEVERITAETNIRVHVNLDESGHRMISTGIGFYDHMLDQVAKHAGMSVEIVCSGDLEIDDHHTVEDVAIAFGSAVKKALGDKLGIERYGFLLPMDESLAQVALDLSGRFTCVFKANFTREKVGELSTELVSHFFHSFAEGLGANINVSVQGKNTHHMVEASFKALGRTLKQAIHKTSNEMPSTKGVL